MKKWIAAACALLLALSLTAVAAAHPSRRHAEPAVTLSFVKDAVPGASYVWNGQVTGDATGQVTVVGMKLAPPNLTIAFVFQGADQSRSFVAQLSGTIDAGGHISLSGTVLGGWLAHAHAQLEATASADLAHVVGTITIDRPAR